MSAEKIEIEFLKSDFNEKVSNLFKIDQESQLIIKNIEIEISQKETSLVSFKET